MACAACERALDLDPSVRSGGERDCEGFGKELPTAQLNGAWAHAAAFVRRDRRVTLWGEDSADERGGCPGAMLTAIGAMAMSSVWAWHSRCCSVRMSWDGNSAAQSRQHPFIFRNNPLTLFGWKMADGGSGGGKLVKMGSVTSLATARSMMTSTGDGRYDVRIVSLSPSSLSLVWAHPRISTRTIRRFMGGAPSVKAGNGSSHAAGVGPEKASQVSREAAAQGASGEGRFGGVWALAAVGRGQLISAGGDERDIGEAGRFFTAD